MIREKTRILSLGGWCRPAYQIARYTQKNGNTAFLKGPFDWAITSFDALKFCMQPDLKREQILESGKIISSSAGSGMCGNSGLIFHHSINRGTLAKFGSFAKGDPIPETDDLRDIIEDAKGRFLYTYGLMRSLRSFDGPILFVRWNHSEEPDPLFPDMSKGETDTSLVAMLTSFLGHDKFHVLSLKSDIISGVATPFSEPITAFRASKNHIECLVNERKGWNGDQTNSFKGDENSWEVAFDHVLSYLDQQDDLKEALH